MEDHVSEQIRKFGGCRRYAFEVITVQSKTSVYREKNIPIFAL